MVTKTASPGANGSFQSLSHIMIVSMLQVSMVSINRRIGYALRRATCKAHCHGNGYSQKMNRCSVYQESMNRCYLSHRHGSVTAIESVKGKRNTRFGF